MYICSSWYFVLLTLSGYELGLNGGRRGHCNSMRPQKVASTYHDVVSCFRPVISLRRVIGCQHHGHFVSRSDDVFVLFWMLSFCAARVSDGVLFCTWSPDHGRRFITTKEPITRSYSKRGCAAPNRSTRLQQHDNITVE